MELKSAKRQRRTRRQPVLIVPLWNWNRSAFLLAFCLLCSNCTFMELKWKTLCQICLPSKSSNCTFMELKLTRSSCFPATAPVLIVPLWNWNWVCNTTYGFVQSSNCTFMELKCCWSTWCYSCWLCSNCTFMELK